MEQLLDLRPAFRSKHLYAFSSSRCNHASAILRSRRTIWEDRPFYLLKRKLLRFHGRENGASEEINMVNFAQVISASKSSLQADLFHNLLPQATGFCELFAGG